MKVELKNCFLEEEHEHAIPYLETYQWEDGSTSQLPACCINSDLGIQEFPSSFKKLIRVDITNTQSQMVSDIRSIELMDGDKNLFFLSDIGDIDGEAPIDCYFIKGKIDEVFPEYLNYFWWLDIPHMLIFSALQKDLLDKNVLSEKWVPVSIFNDNGDYDALSMSIEMHKSNLQLNDLINKVTLDESKIDLWRNQINQIDFKQRVISAKSL